MLVSLTVLWMSLSVRALHHIPLMLSRISLSVSLLPFALLSHPHPHHGESPSLKISSQLRVLVVGRVLEHISRKSFAVLSQTTSMSFGPCGKLYLARLRWHIVSRDVGLDWLRSGGV